MTGSKGEPFSTLLKMDPHVLAAIQEDMERNGCDPSHPIHVWLSGDKHILIDGYTRCQAAQTLGIKTLPAFVHDFADETKALDYAIRCQVNRRNIKDSELIMLVRIYDEKIPPGSDQGRDKGKFQPKASDDAIGKSAAVTADALGTSTTKIERVRRVIAKADPAMLVKIGNDKMTINAAAEALRKHAKNLVTTRTKTVKADSAIDPFEALADSDMAFARWNVLQRAAPIVGDEKVTQDPAPTYAVPDGCLDLSFKKSVIKGIGAKWGHRRVSVSPDVDIFAPDVPVSITREILKAAHNANEIEFLFITRTPARLCEFSWETNTFAGVSISEQRDVDAAEEALVAVKAARKWLLVEQLTMQLKFNHLKSVDWLVVKTSSPLIKAAPAPDALKKLLQLAWEANCPVFFEKGNEYRAVAPPRHFMVNDTPRTVEGGAE